MNKWNVQERLERLENPHRETELTNKKKIELKFSTIKLKWGLFAK